MGLERNVFSVLWVNMKFGLKTEKIIFVISKNLKLVSDPASHICVSCQTVVTTIGTHWVAA